MSASSIRSPAATGLTWPERRNWLRQFRRGVAQQGMAIAARVAEEIGKPVGEAYVSEVLPLLAAIRWHERRAERLLAPRRASGRPAWLMGRGVRVARMPIGHGLIVATWNYPVGLLGVQLVQAVAAGNRVTVKPSERSPQSQAMLVRLACSCGLPEGWISLAPPTRRAGAALVERGQFDKVVFTGGSATGAVVAGVCARRMIPSVLELSGHDSALVLADADAAVAADRIWLAVTMNAGQTCMAPRRALVDRRVYRRFVETLSTLAAAARPMRLTSAAEATACVRLAGLAMEHGARSASGVLEPACDGWLRPMAMLDCPPEAELFRGEHFGPVLAVVPVDDLAHAQSLHARVRNRLSVSVYGGPAADLLARDPGFVASLGASVVTFNESVTPTGHPAVPIAGQGASGWGASRGEDGLLAWTRPVTVSRTAWWTPSARAPEGGQLAWLDRLVRWWHGARSPCCVVEPAAVAASDMVDPKRPEAAEMEGWA